jgi:hypothetical protein
MEEQTEPEFWAVEHPTDTVKIARSRPASTEEINRSVVANSKIGIEVFWGREGAKHKAAVINEQIRQAANTPPAPQPE